MRVLRWLGGAGVGVALGFWTVGAVAEGISVVTSIKPVHSLTAAVMQGAGAPRLIVRGGASPHGHSLRPSDAAALDGADVVVWIGAGLETFLESSIAALASDARVVELAEAPGLTRLPYRAGGAWDGHTHEDHHHHDAVDMHLWLDPQNAKAMAAAVTEALIAADPGNGDLYAGNARRLSTRLDRLTEELAADLAPVKEVPFVVFHDAFQYFDTRFGLNNVGAVTVGPELQPGAAQLREMQVKIAELDARCVFAEPQFEPRLIQVVIEGTAAKTGTLDPIGADIADGPELYFELMRNNTAALKACLAEAS